MGTERPAGELDAGSLVLFLATYHQQGAPERIGEDMAQPHPTGAVASLDDPLILGPAAGAFRDRRDAGRRLAALLEPFRSQRPVVVGIPRGGVPVAAEVADALGAPLDVVLVRKIGAPANPEYAIGAVAEGGVHVISSETAHALGLSDADVRELIERAEEELARRSAAYRGSEQPADLEGRTVILVDDGLATGRSAQAAIHSVRRRGAAHVILAVPVAAPESVRALRSEADQIVCVEMPEDLWAVGLWYRDFRPTSDDEVVGALERGATPDAALGEGAGASPPEVAIDVGLGAPLLGELTLPPDARAVVAFAHGSGSSRLSPRNRAVAAALNDAGFGTLLFDLLTPDEDAERENVFDIPLLASRLLAASGWLAAHRDCGRLPLAYFGASTGAAAALTAAGELGDRVGAVISRGGRTDLAAEVERVSAPTLLIVGGEDRLVLELNRETQRRLRCPCELAVVPGAGHLFEEPGALEEVSALAVGWLQRHLGGLVPDTRTEGGDPPSAP